MYSFGSVSGPEKAISVFPMSSAGILGQTYAWVPGIGDCTGNSVADASVTDSLVTDKLG